MTDGKLVFIDANAQSDKKSIFHKQWIDKTAK